MQLRATTTDSLIALSELIKKYPKTQAQAIIPSSSEVLMDVVKTPFWPSAVPETMVVRDEPTKKIRASSIVSSFIKQPLKGKRFLDFGCGEGHTTIEAQRAGAEVAIGYDVVTNPNWAKNPEIQFTTDFAAIQAVAPFDAILLYDVLDHCVDTEPLDVLKKIASLMGQNTKLYVRCHPFSASHGNHGYITFNKAYAHLFFSTDELKALGAVFELVRVFNPLNRIDGQYRDWITAAGLSVVGQPTKISINPDPFFLDQFMLNELNRRFYPTKPADNEVLKNMLSVQFVDYTLTRPNSPVLQNV